MMPFNEHRSRSRHQILSQTSHPKNNILIPKKLRYRLNGILHEMTEQRRLQYSPQESLRLTQNNKKSTKSVIIADADQQRLKRTQRGNSGILSNIITDLCWPSRITVENRKPLVVTPDIVTLSLFSESS